MTADQYPAPGARPLTDVFAAIEAMDDAQAFIAEVVAVTDQAWTVQSYRPRHQEFTDRGLVATKPLHCGREYNGHHRKWVEA